MAWVKYNGSVLKRDGKVAIDLNCCCEEVECGECPWGTPSMGDIPDGETAIDTLYAHITAVEGCECLDGLCIPLTWRAGGVWGIGNWQGTIAIPCLNLPEEDRFLTLVFGCCGALSVPGSGRFWLGADDCGEGENPASGSPCPDLLPPINVSVPSETQACRPYSVTFINMPGLNCCGVMPATFNVLVDENPC